MVPFQPSSSAHPPRPPHAIGPTYSGGARRDTVSSRTLSVLTCRARQRTFEAAYWRTSLGQFSFALVILKIFQAEFYAIGGTALLPAHC